MPDEINYVTAGEIDWVKLRETEYTAGGRHREDSMPGWVPWVPVEKKG